mmetsp:Transcript_3889/g.4566  ORF Transcript_3889/g.4566 Transcript_3889/m.4566 type:complete len:178 (+) Transcript_3889:93-626(+)
MARTTNNSPPDAGHFDKDAEYRFKCYVRKGDVRTNPRGGTPFDFTVKISEGLEVAKAKVLTFVRRSISGAQLISEYLYFKRSKGCPQSQYVTLSDENFESMTERRWKLITQRDVTSWANEEQPKTPLEKFEFETFMYIHKRTSENIDKPNSWMSGDKIWQEHVKKKVTMTDITKRLR